VAIEDVSAACLSAFCLLLKLAIVFETEAQVLVLRACLRSSTESLNGRLLASVCGVTLALGSVEVPGSVPLEYGDAVIGTSGGIEFCSAAYALSEASKVP